MREVRETLWKPRRRTFQAVNCTCKGPESERAKKAVWMEQSEAEGERQESVKGASRVQTVRHGVQMRKVGRKR